MRGRAAKWSLYSFCVLVFTLFQFSGLLWAQIDQGAIVGTVQDKTGAIVPDAKVTLNDENTGLTLATTTGADGIYVFSPIKIGVYTVNVEKPGFAKTTQLHVTVDIGAKVKVDFVLSPGTVNESVEVTGATPLLQTQTTSVGQNLTASQITDVPLVSRNYTFLAQLSAGVTSNFSRVAGTGGFTANGLQWSHNSYLLDGIDNNNDTMDFLNGAAYVVLPPPDAIQEVRVDTSDFPAEYGRAGSAVLNATTKSGTNKFHGDAWEFFRNDALDANSWANETINHLTKPAIRYNQFGFTLGGPLGIPHLFSGRNKNFFFVDYQGTIIHQQSTGTATVPTAAMKNSNFTNLQEMITDQPGTPFNDALGRLFPIGTILDPATSRTVSAGQVDPVTGLVANATGTVRDPFFAGQSVVGVTNFTTATNEALLNLLPAGRLDPNAIKLLSAYPAANVPPSSFNNNGLFNNYSVLEPNPNKIQQVDARVDQNIDSKNQTFERFSYWHNHKTSFNVFSGPPLDNSGFGQGDFLDIGVNAAVSYTHLFSPTLINEARVGFGRLTDSAAPAIASVQGIPAQFGIQGVPPGAGGGLPFVNISGLTTIGPGEFASPNTRITDTVQFTENLTKVHGPHTFKGGFEVQLIRSEFDDPRDPRGRMDFRGNYSGALSCSVKVAGSAGCGGGGSGMTDLLLTPTTATVANGIDYEGGPGFAIADSNVQPDNLRHYYGAYLQDDWKVTGKLTVNLGLRWEFFGQPRGAGGEAILAPGSPLGGPAYIISSNAQNVPLSSAFTSLLSKDGIALRFSNVAGLIPTPTDNYAPRAGVAYQVTRKMVLRSSFGAFYAGFENIGGSPDPGTNYPFAVEPSLNDSSGGSQTLRSQNPSAFPSGVNFATMENILTLVTPNPTSPAFNPEGSGLNAFATDWHTATTYEWNLFLQYALTPNDSLQAGYVGDHSLHLINGWRTNSLDQIFINGTPGTVLNAAYPFPDFAHNMNYVVPNGDSYYHALQITYERKFSHGVQTLANFTQALCRTDIRNVLNDNTSGQSLQRAAYLPGFGVKGDYQSCADDHPRSLHASGTWELPFGRGQRFGSHFNGLTNQILGRWVVNGIWTLQDGSPGTVGCPSGTTADFGCVANIVPGQPIYLRSGPHGIKEFLNPAAFSQPPAATTSGQTDLSPLGGPATQFFGPGFDNLDFSAFKRFPITESRYLEFRGEFFNVFNHPNFGLPSNLNFTQSNFAQLRNMSSGYTARTTQLALKFFW